MIKPFVANSILIMTPKCNKPTDNHKKGFKINLQYDRKRHETTEKKKKKPTDTGYKTNDFFEIIRLKINKLTGNKMQKCNPCSGVLGCI